MPCYGRYLNINILLKYLLKTSLTHFIALVFFYISWNTSENERFPDVFRGIERDASKRARRHLLIKLFLYFFNTSSGFFFQFEGCIINCFHAYFVFDFVLVVLIVVFAPSVYLSEIKVNICLLFFANELLWFNKSIDVFYFVNMLLFIRLFWYKEGGKIVYWIFIVN